MRSTRGLLAVLALALGVFLPVAAQAAVTQDGTIDYQIWMAPDPGIAIVLVSVELSADATLPATVRLPVPEGMTVDWAGEVGGGDASNDIARQYVLKDGDGGKYAEFQLSEHRMAQIDVSGKQFDSTASEVDVVFDLVQSVQAEECAFSVRVPSGMSEVEIDPAPVDDPVSNGLGEVLYTLPSEKLSSGAVTRVSVAYSTLAAPDTPSSPFAMIIWVLGVAVVVTAAVLVLALRRQGSVSEGLTAEEDE